ncbi:chemotaxis methyl-accepting receptor [Lucifera butyrica]|uniref:Chemotaxis methyl-accepting receptor n=1 Tax=Lucifera butyrica TaxID=1351585 RepID=A0A498R9G9_9FIRM|nr:methyl-accepting chemotaxis protein [Lucifera butyrica]VBB07597.1 chemotaxis methyl-accepting receptor [Lucifera butyrica]
MTWFENLKIANKLIISFLMIAIIGAVVGTVGVFNLYNLTAEDGRLYDYYTVPLPQISSVAESYYKIRVNAQEMMLDKDVNNRAAYIAKTDAELKSMKDQIAIFTNTLVSDAGRQETRELGKAVDGLESYLKKFYSLIEAGQNDQAYQLMRTEGVEREAAIQKSIDNLIGMKINLAQGQANRNKADAHRAIYIMIAFVIMGAMAALALGVFIARRMSQPVRELVTVADKVAGGDLNVAIQVRSRDEIGLLSQSFSSMAENINRAMCSIDEAAEQVAAGAQQIAASGQALSQGSTEQASSIEEITASMTQVAAQTKQNAVSANQANELAAMAKEQAMEGNIQMQGMVKAMAEINESSTNISRIIKVIDEIAFQTNILALNAAVEAARAGQHGKGFAVVAEEVRNLAARSANAAKETTAMIEGSIKKVDAGTQIANQTAEALNGIVDGVAKAAALVGDIAAASNEQATAISQVNQAIAQVSQVVQTNSATAEESAAASEELSGQAEIMKENVRKFKLKPIGRGLKGGAGTTVSPEVLQAIESMLEKKKQTEPAGSGPHQPSLTPKARILLDDNEFGKY